MIMNLMGLFLKSQAHTGASWRIPLTYTCTHSHTHSQRGQVVSGLSLPQYMHTNSASRKTLRANGNPEKNSKKKIRKI